MEGIFIHRAKNLDIGCFWGKSNIEQGISNVQVAFRKREALTPPNPPDPNFDNELPQPNPQFESFRYRPGPPVLYP